MNNTRLSSKKTRLTIWIMGIILLIIVIGLGGSAYYINRSYNNNLTPLDVNSERKDSIIIEQGTTAKGAALRLEQEAIIRKSWAFEWYMRRNNLNGKIQAGTYRLGPSLSVPQIVEMITEGKVETKLVRIPSGKRLDQLKSVFTDEGYSEQEVERALDPALYKDHPVLVGLPQGSSLEGYIYPDSYQKTVNTKAETIVKSALDQMYKQLTPEVLAGFAKQGLTLHQGVILASIVEKEVSNPNDKPMVAQVFIKRYKIGMALGSDVTAFYGSAVVGKLDLNNVYYDSPYNTRIYSGLPPGPISNLTNTSLQAVANPALTDYLYFVAGDDGTTYFSKTVAEHEAFVQQYCTKLCGR